MKWFEQSAAGGVLHAYIDLGVCYYNGLGVDQDIVLTPKNFRIVGGGMPEAQLCLGNMYMIGKGVEKDPTETVNWFRKATKRDKTNAQFNVGGHVRERQRRPQDLEETVR